MRLTYIHGRAAEQGDDANMGAQQDSKLEPTDDGFMANNDTATIAPSQEQRVQLSGAFTNSFQNTR